MDFDEIRKLSESLPNKLFVTTPNFEKALRANLSKFNIPNAHIVVVDKYNLESILKIQESSLVLVLLDFPFYRELFSSIHTPILVSDFLGWSFTNSFTPLDFYPDESIEKVVDEFEDSRFLRFLHDGYARRLYEVRRLLPLSEYTIADIVAFETFLTMYFRPLVYNMKVRDCYFHPIAIPFTKASDVIADCGACSSKHGGEFATSFAKLSSKGHVYAFEPVKEIYQQLLEDTKSFHNITILNAAVWSSNTLLHICSDGMTSKVSETGDLTHALSIDSYFGGEKVDFIKMDIEGAEIEALYGAEKTIRKHKPTLAICAYHKPDDVHRIVKALKTFYPGYKLWIECNEGHAWCGVKVFAKASS